MRALFYEFPNKSEYFNISSQFLVGGNNSLPPCSLSAHRAERWFACPLPASATPYFAISVAGVRPAPVHLSDPTLVAAQAISYGTRRIFLLIRLKLCASERRELREFCGWPLRDPREVLPVVSACCCQLGAACCAVMPAPAEPNLARCWTPSLRHLPFVSPASLVNPAAAYHIPRGLRLELPFHDDAPAPPLLHS